MLWKIWKICFCTSMLFFDSSNLGDLDSFPGCRRKIELSFLLTGQFGWSNFGFQKVRKDVHDRYIKLVWHEKTVELTFAFSFHNSYPEFYQVVGEFWRTFRRVFKSPRVIFEVCKSISWMPQSFEG